MRHFLATERRNGGLMCNHNDIIEEVYEDNPVMAGAVLLVGYLMVSVSCGVVAAVSALFVGLSVGWALVAYASAGATGVLLTAALRVAYPHTAEFQAARKRQNP